MISLELATRLRRAGVAWEPAPGDRFVIPQPELREQVFVLSDLTVDVHEFPGGRVLAFNGTTEWALDSVPQGATIWLPREDQLRDLLGAEFTRLERCGDGHRVTLADGTTLEHADPEEAYGLALLHVLTGR